MAVTRAGSVVLATADADSITGPLRICGVKLVGGAGGATVNLKDGGTSGTVLYSSTVGNSSEKFEEVDIRAPSSVYVNISAGGGTIYLYLK